MRRRSVAAFTALALAALALTACSTNDGPDGPGGSADDGLEVGAAWLAGGTLIALVTDGSSSCRPFVDGAVVDDGVLVVTLNENTGEDQACTADLVQRGTVVGVPDGITPGTGIDIQVTLDGAAGETSFGETSLPDYTGEAASEHAPSAGWVDADTFALLTWGSSSCAPQVESAVVKTPDSIEVTFVQPPADQVCTMDLAPQVAVVTIEGDVSPDATISVAGGGERPGGAIPID